MAHRKSRSVGPPRMKGAPIRPRRGHPRSALLLLTAAGLALVVACASRATHTGSTLAGMPAFDSSAAWHYLEAQLGFGPRPVGTPAHEQLRDYLAAELRRDSADVQLQQWTDPTIHLPLTNLIAR